MPVYLLLVSSSGIKTTVFVILDVEYKILACYGECNQGFLFGSIQNQYFLMIGINWRSYTFWFLSYSSFANYSETSFAQRFVIAFSIQWFALAKQKDIHNKNYPETFIAEYFLFLAYVKSTYIAYNNNPDCFNRMTAKANYHFFIYLWGGAM